MEVLISDCKGDAASLGPIFAARPDVLNHNIETVARLQRAVRPSAGYARSLAVLARAGRRRAGRQVGPDGRPGRARGRGAGHPGRPECGRGRHRHHRPVPEADVRPPAGGPVVDARGVRGPGRAGRRLGLAHVEASPLTRSSYHARDAAAAASGQDKPAQDNAGQVRERAAG